jgi:hypothetical protein
LEVHRLRRPVQARYDGQPEHPWDYGRNSHFGVGFNRLDELALLVLEVVVDAPLGTTWNQAL